MVKRLFCCKTLLKHCEMQLQHRIPAAPCWLYQNTFFYVLFCFVSFSHVWGRFYRTARARLSPRNWEKSCRSQRPPGTLRCCCCRHTNTPINSSTRNLTQTETLKRNKKLRFLFYFPEFKFCGSFLQEHFDTVQLHLTAFHYICKKNPYFAFFKTHLQIKINFKWLHGLKRTPDTYFIKQQLI